MILTFKNLVMKKLIIFCSIAMSTFLLSSCKKDNTSVGLSDNPTVRFEFTADAPAAYGMHAYAGYDSFDETINGTTWSKTVKPARVNHGEGSDTASFLVTAPVTWMSTGNTANISMKIFVNNVEKASKNMVLFYIDRSSAFVLKAAY